MYSFVKVGPSKNFALKTHVLYKTPYKSFAKKSTEAILDYFFEIDYQLDEESEISEAEFNVMKKYLHVLEYTENQIKFIKA